MDLRGLPLFVYILIVFTMMMYVPAVYALVLNDIKTAQVFIFNGTVLLTVVTLIALAIINRKPKSSGRLHLITILMAYLIVPLICAFPFSNLVPFISFSQAYFEMMSSMTTTGATLFWDPDVISRPLHLWRGLVAWAGGFLILAAALAIMEPLSLGGFEIRTGAGELGQGQQRLARREYSASDRVVRVVSRLGPVYLLFTAVLFAVLIFFGDDPFVAFCHAMAIISTSGISPVGGLHMGKSGFGGEIFIFIFFLTAMSHMFYNTRSWRSFPSLFKSPELKVARTVIIVCSALIVVGFLYAAFRGGEDVREVLNFRNLWGVVFTVTSFLSTTGFYSQFWETAQFWEGHNTNGLILVSLALLGGGIATTAGGLKLLRVYVLLKHGERELARLVHPSSVWGFGSDARYIRREGAYVTWMFVMLFVLSIALISLALSLCGVEFQTAFVLTIASLSNTGPLATVFGLDLQTYASLSDNARMYLDISMIIGRMEVLAVVALLNTSLWQR